MSISPRNSDTPAPGRWTPPPDATVHDGVDELLEPTQPPLDGDVGVEEIPERLHGGNGHHRLKRSRGWHRNSSFSSSTDPSEEEYESDATFRLPLRPTPPVQASAVEHPHDSPVQSYQSLDGPHVEVIDTPSKRKQRSTEGEPRAKRRRDVAPIEVDMEGLPEGSYGPGWYEPEKDRIVITSLSSPEGSPPPDTAHPYPFADDDGNGNGRTYSFNENRNLSQPGAHGFTISPSLLTHIINAQRNQSVQTPYVPGGERGLVLYRPIGTPAADNVVKEWHPGHHHTIPDPDGDRFEEVDDDEDLMAGSSTPIVGVAVDDMMSDSQMNGMNGMNGNNCNFGDYYGMDGGDSQMDGFMNMNGMEASAPQPPVTEEGYQWAPDDEAMDVE